MIKLLSICLMVFAHPNEAPPLTALYQWRFSEIQKSGSNAIRGNPLEAESKVAEGLQRDGNDDRPMDAKELDAQTDDGTWRNNFFDSGVQDTGKKIDVASRSGDLKDSRKNTKDMDKDGSKDSGNDALRDTGKKLSNDTAKGDVSAGLIKSSSSVTFLDESHREIREALKKMDADSLADFDAFVNFQQKHHRDTSRFVGPDKVLPVLKGGESLHETTRVNRHASRWSYFTIGTIVVAIVLLVAISVHKYLNVRRKIVFDEF